MIKTLVAIKKIKWQPTALLLVGIMFLSSIYLYKINNLVPGINPLEQKISGAILGWHGLYVNPLYLPIKIVRSIIFKFNSSHSILSLRLPSVIFAIISVIALGIVMRFWYGRRVALLVSILFALSSWTLHVARFDSNNSLYLSLIPLLLLSYLLIKKYHKNILVFYLYWLICAIALYVPGSIYFILMLGWINRKELSYRWSQQRQWWSKLLNIFYILILIVPLFSNLYFNANKIFIWLGLPNKLPLISSIFHNFSNIFIELFLIGPKNPALWLVNVPILDFFSAILTLIGFYVIIRNYKNSICKQMISLIMISLALLTLAGPVNFSIIMPLIYLLIASGIKYLLVKWDKTFPFNPIAHKFATLMISLAVLTSCIYNIRSYFIAWPHNNQTKTVFIRKG